jgi:hypothetical protein
MLSEDDRSHRVNFRVGNQPEAKAGRMAQEAKALSNIKDKLT